MGLEVLHNPYHVAVVNQNLTRNLEVLYPEIRDEVVMSFSEILDLKEHEWKSVPVLSVIQKVVCRTSNRVFVGLPLCRNPDWMDLNIRCTIDFLQGGFLIGLFPEFMRSLVTRFLTKIPQCVARSVELLGPTIEERLKYLDEYGKEWDDKPNDLLSWLMDAAEGPELSVKRLTVRVLSVNFAAIHTTSSTLTTVLFYLAANPQYVQPLREEVESIVEKDGWSKAALNKMQKVDSFLKECLRIEGIDMATVFRKAMKDFTFSDGTIIPKGTLIAFPTIARHHDNNFYENPDTFEPFRFTHPSKEHGEGAKHQFASTSAEYLAFGHGRHACPGRFFAASELKIMLAHIVVAYDIKLEDGATRPENWHIGKFVVVNSRVNIVIRNRAVN